MAVFLSADVFVFETLLMQLNPWKLYYEFSFFFFFFVQDRPVYSFICSFFFFFFFTLLFLIIFALVMLRFSLIVTIYAMHISLPFHVT